MARYDTQQLSQVKLVLIAAHLPDCVFEGGFISGSIDSMPVSGVILELKRCLWDTKYVEEYNQFITLMKYPQWEERQAKALGIESVEKVPNVKRHIDETLIEDAAYRMPQWLANKSLDIYDLNLKGASEIW
jgi:hypothetical protein